jgi:hypothetical protein
MVYKGRIEGRILWVRVCTISSKKYICPQRTVPQYSLCSVVVSVNDISFEASKEETHVREINVKVNNSSIGIVAINNILPYKLGEFFILAFAVC